MKHVLALVGRPNVGKSTLFNRLTRSRDALVADEPGLTRDRRYGQARHQGHEFIVVDTGGLSGDGGIDHLIEQQVLRALEESSGVLFLVDGRAGLCAGDQRIADQLRNLGKPVFVVVNKTERQHKALLSAEFHQLGLGQPLAISAAHGEGVGELLEQVFESLPEIPPDTAETEHGQGAKVAVIGRPNVGKSTLVNRLLGEERVLAFDLPGTTRDSIFIPFERDGQHFTLIDTAGVRRRGRIHDKIEKFSVIKTLQAIDAANVVILVIDAQEGIGSQDANLLGYAIDAGKALLIAVNKWDGLTPERRERIKTELERRLRFVDYASIHFISALHGSGVGKLMGVVQQAYEKSRAQFPTPLLTRILEDAVASHQPPLVKGRRIKLRYAHQGGQNPPRIVIHGNQVQQVPDSYRRYLANVYRKVLKLEGTPVRIEFRSGENPFKGRKNTLSKRQLAKRKRLKDYIKKKYKKS